MRILILHRPSGMMGGDTRIAIEYTESLCAAGIDAVVRPADKLDGLDAFDIVHLWAACSPDWGLPAVWAAKQAGVFLAVTPIWWPRDLRLRYYNSGSDVAPGYISSVRSILADADILTPFTASEMLECWKLAPDRPAYVMGRGIKRYGVEPKTNENFAFSAARVEPHKNQYAIALACRRLNIPYVCAGPVADETYAKACASAGAMMLGEIEHDQVLDLMSRSTCHVNASFSENISTATAEAWDVGIPAVSTIEGGEPEFFGGSAFYCRPDDWHSISEAIRDAQFTRASGANPWLDTPPTWESVARRAIARYQRWAE